MSLETNQVIVHDLKDNDIALATSLELAVIMKKDNLIEITPYLTKQLQSSLTLNKNISRSKNTP